MKASVAHRSITAKRQVHEVGCALNLLWKFTILKTADQMNAAVKAIVDIQEIIVGLNTETTESQKKRKIKQFVAVLLILKHQNVQIKNALLFQKESVHYSPTSESCQMICFASPDKAIKKDISPKR